VASTNDHNSKTDRNTIAETGPHEAGEFKPRLIVVSGMMLGLQIELGTEPVTIGRASECALSLQHPSVSRHHCEISRDGDHYFIEDLGSTNRTYLNGKAVRREELHDGDQISVGNNAIKFFTGHSLEAKYHDELIDLAIYDSLTGFYNRRHFHTLLEEEIERAKGSMPVSVLMMDLDHFKNITEKLRNAIAGKPVETRDQKLPITISIGVAQTGGKVKTAAELLNCADDRLYRAKQAGRNCVWSKD
jgi:GGDEF domain-containing protein